MTRLSVVTGASSGIGEAVVARLVARGDRVVAVARRPDGLAALAARHGDQVQPLALDVGDHAAVHAALAALPPVHTLVLSAGICKQARLDEEADDATWWETLNVNLHGSYFAVKAVAPTMPSGGRIVAVSSGLGKLGRPGYAAYCASKHALLGIVKCVAKELAPRGITVNAVCPGWVATRMAEEAIARIAAKTGRDAAAATAALTGMSPQRRLIEPAEVAHAVAMLCSHDARGIHGQTIVLDGGQVLK